MSEAVVQLLGPNLLVKEGGAAASQASTSQALQGKHVGLLFTRSYVPACHRFLPTLQQCYTSVKGAGLPFEIVYVSLESDQPQFEECFSNQPWAALPFGSSHAAKLVQRFCKQGMPLPVLVMLDPDAHLLSEDARMAVVRNPHGFPWTAEAPPSAVTRVLNRYSSYLMPLALLLYMAYRMYFQETVHALVGQHVHPLLEAGQKAVQPAVDAVYRLLYKAYFGVEPQGHAEL